MTKKKNEGGSRVKQSRSISINLPKGGLFLTGEEDLAQWGCEEDRRDFDDHLLDQLWPCSLSRSMARFCRCIWRAWASCRSQPLSSYWPSPAVSLVGISTSPVVSFDCRWGARDPWELFWPAVVAVASGVVVAECLLAMNSSKGSVHLDNRGYSISWVN